MCLNHHNYVGLRDENPNETCQQLDEEQTSDVAYPFDAKDRRVAPRKIKLKKGSGELMILTPLITGEYNDVGPIATWNAHATKSYLYTHAYS